ncbi:cell division protein FtsK, partial [Streptomyces sp. SID8380]|nr:cell division protein FtsK [Streptomyces sp. SID8380]
MWLGLAHGIGAMLRGIGRGAKGLDPAHRKDGLALLLLGLALVVAAGTWSRLDGPVGELVELLVTGAFGRLDLLVPILLGVVAVRLIRHPEQPEANGRIVIGLSALVVGVLGQVHIACGAPSRDAGIEALQDAGGLIGWAAASPLIFTMSEVLAVPLLLLLTVFGLLVVTATPVNAIPQRLRRLGVRLGIFSEEAGADEEFVGHGHGAREDDADELAQARRRRTATRRRGPAPYDVDAEEAALERRRASGSGVFEDRDLDPVDVAARAAAALDGAVLHGLPPSSLVADLTHGVGTGRREGESTTPVPTPREKAGT